MLRTSSLYEDLLDRVQATPSYVVKSDHHHPSFNEALFQRVTDNATFIVGFDHPQNPIWIRSESATTEMDEEIKDEATYQRVCNQLDLPPTFAQCPFRYCVNTRLLPIGATILYESPDVCYSGRVCLNDHSRPSIMQEESDTVFYSFRQFLLAAGVQSKDIYKRLLALKMRTPTGQVSTFSALRQQHTRDYMAEHHNVSYWIARSAGISANVASSFGAYVHEQEFELDIERKVGDHLAAFYDKSDVVPPSTSDAKSSNQWSQLLNFFEVDPFVRERIDNLRGSFLPIFDKQEPISFMAKYVEAVYEDVMQTGPFAEEKRVDGDEGHVVDRDIHLHRRVTKGVALNLSSSKTERSIRAISRAALFATLAAIYGTFPKSNEFWFHGCGQAALDHMQRTSINITGLWREPRSLDSSAAFYFANHFEYALYRSLAKHTPGDSAYVLVVMKNKSALEKVPRQLDLREDIPQLMQCALHHQQEFHSKKDRGMTPAHWKYPTTSMIRGFVNARRPEQPEDCKFMWTHKGFSTPRFIQKNVEQICFLEEHVLHDFLSDGLGVIEIDVPSPLHLEELRQFASERAISASVLNDVMTVKRRSFSNGT